MHASLSPEIANHYRLVARNALLSKQGVEFEAWFAELMTAKHGPDFYNPQPWGSEGDWGSDGYLLPDDHVFQCYAPRSYKKFDLISKMNETAKRAGDKWDNLQRWTFVFNDDGAPAECAVVLKELETKLGVPCRIWVRKDLLQCVGTLHEHQLREFLPPFPDVLSFDDITVDAIQDVIYAIERLGTEDILQFEAPVPGKLEHNDVNTTWRNHLIQGMTAGNRIREVFEKSSDPDLGTRVIGILNHEYRMVKGSCSDSNEVLDTLARRIRRNLRGRHHDDLATYAVLTYAFELCKVLEPVPPEKT